jgi:hypothetical protein
MAMAGRHDRLDGRMSLACRAQTSLISPSLHILYGELSCSKIPQTKIASWLIPQVPISSANIAQAVGYGLLESFE